MRTSTVFLLAALFANHFTVSAEARVSHSPYKALSLYQQAASHALLLPSALAPFPGNGGTADTLEWERPRFAERDGERQRLVNTVREQGASDAAVLESLASVPRHRFVPEQLQSEAYRNNPLPIGYGQTISQPFIVAYMNEMLGLQPGDRVLEIGTGSGYHAATLAELTPHVYSVEIIRELGEQAARLYDELGYSTIRTRIGDGYYGWEEHAPYDAIIVTAASGHVPPPLIEQLRPGGVIVIPVGSPFQTQTLMRVIKQEDGNVRTERDLPVRFVPMTGAAQQQ